jgi:two-component system, OmpR family, phosphate regulon sensor histidine kinase PhoR
VQPDIVAGAFGVLVGAGAAYAALRPFTGERRLNGERASSFPAEEEDRAARLVGALPFAAFTVDERGKVRVFNAASEALFECGSERAIGRALIEVIPSVELERMIQRALDGETRTRDLVFGAGARERYVGITVQPYDGGAIAIATDRTAYLAAERVRREFTGNVSHELRTPLSAMKLMLETVMLSEEDAEARRLFLPQIAQEVERMIDLVQDLLELARSEAGVITLRRERLDLTEVASSTVGTFAQRADSLGITLVLEAAAPVEVDADRARLTQVALNLVDNALRHTPAGGRVTVAVGREGDEAFLRVRDTGIGIPFGDLPRIFERFYVVDRSRSREHGGTGLGLSIAKHLVEAHGGTLTAGSVYGQGATFTMRVAALASTRKD